ncbi:gamma adaptin [Theileria orientalis]|uniref:AP-1 complex subunit gamma n=1 Tax=Theileria orientalis TaxID=68886 RepID=A0A976QSX7_THEOR|nr:gamma adaptin [Theileria orientalis]
MSGSVKDLIRNIRGSKTASEERSVLAKECAKIRSSLNSDSLTSRRRNISKLLFINLLGHPTNFGQVECIKLIASSKFYDKRTGYLALNLLLNEDSEVLMLATNSIKIDLNDPNPYVREMALRALANVGTNEMLRELQYEIEVNMAHNVPNIRKKATVCTVRMLRKEANRNLTPDSISVSLATSYLKYIEPLVGDYDNGVKLAGLSLMSVMLEHYTEICDLDSFYGLLINALVQTLSPNQSNFTVTIPAGSDAFTNQNVFNDQSLDDPFVKIKLLKQLKKVYLKLTSNKSQQIAGGAESNRDLLGETSFDMRLVGYREKLYEIVSTIINSVKFDGNRNYAILLECVSAIDSDFGEERFNDLGKLVVKKFMSGKDNNVKYLALGIIMKLHNVNMVLGDTNWTIIVQSLKQPDMSIRKKALEVSLKVVNASILDPLLNYLYEFLLSADEDTRKESMYNIFNCVKKHSEDVAYKLQVFVKIFTIAGNSVQDLILFEFIELLVSSGDEVKRKTTLELLKVLRYNMGQSALVKTSLYSIGEYYDLLSKEDLKNIFSTQIPLSAGGGSGSRLNKVNNYTSMPSDEYKGGRGLNEGETGVHGSDYMSNARNGYTEGAGMNKLINETSVDLLLDLSTPTNRNSQTARRDYGTIYETTEDDLLLDVFSPENSTASNNAANTAAATNAGEMFDLCDLSTPKANLDIMGSLVGGPSGVGGDLNLADLKSPTRLDSLESPSKRLNLDYMASPAILESKPGANSSQDYESMVVELIENLTMRLLTKNLLNECEYLITCVGKLSQKMPKQVENLRKILKKFRRHSNPELQQRSCELEIILKENIMSLLTTGERALSELYNEDEFASKSESRKILVSDDGLKDDDEDDFMKITASMKSQSDGKSGYSGSTSSKNDYKVDSIGYTSIDGNTVYSGIDKGSDIFDEFFSATGNTSTQPHLTATASTTNNSTATNALDMVDFTGEKDPFNMDKLASSIVQNVSVASARGNREDDFQQFDPF